VSDGAPLPVVIITGFLGAGKTSLLNTLLRAPELTSSLVLINEWGEVGLDHLLIEKVVGDMILLNSGCVCCTLRGDLVEALRSCLERRDSGAIPPFERIMVETTGLAEPSPVMQAIVGDAVLARRLRLAGIVTLVDAINGEETLARHSVAARQVAVADLLAISKSDLINPATRAATPHDLAATLRALNPVAGILDGAAGELGPKDLLDLMRQDSIRAGHESTTLTTPLFHNAWIKTRVLRVTVPLEANAFAAFLALLSEQLGPKLLRIKGLVALNDNPERPLVLQGAQHLLDVTRRLVRWPDADRTTRIVLIVEGMSAATIDRLWGALTHAPAVDAPDMAALTQSPLSLPRGGLMD